MAEVFKGWDNRCAAHLAMRILRQDISQHPFFLRSFQPEMQALARLQQRPIVHF